MSRPTARPIPRVCSLLGVVVALHLAARLDATVDAGDLGFDQVRIALPGTVQEVRMDGVALPPEAYTSTWDAGELGLALDSDYRVESSGSLEMDFTGALLRPTLAVRAGVLVLYPHTAPQGHHIVINDSQLGPALSFHEGEGDQRTLTEFELLAHLAGDGHLALRGHSC